MYANIHFAFSCTKFEQIYIFCGFAHLRVDSHLSCLRLFACLALDVNTSKVKRNKTEIHLNLRQPAACGTICFLLR